METLLLPLWQNSGFTQNLWLNSVHVTLSHTGRALERICLRFLKHPPERGNDTAVEHSNWNRAEPLVSAPESTYCLCNKAFLIRSQATLRPQHSSVRAILPVPSALSLHGRINSALKKRSSLGPHRVTGACPAGCPCYWYAKWDCLLLSYKRTRGCSTLWRATTTVQLRKACRHPSAEARGPSTTDHAFSRTPIASGSGSFPSDGRTLRPQRLSRLPTGQTQPAPSRSAGAHGGRFAFPLSYPRSSRPRGAGRGGPPAHHRDAAAGGARAPPGRRGKVGGYAAARWWRRHRCAWCGAAAAAASAAPGPSSPPIPSKSERDPHPGWDRGPWGWGGRAQQRGRPRPVSHRGLLLAAPLSRGRRGDGLSPSPARYLLCASGDFVKMYSVATEETLRLMGGHAALVTGVQLNPHNHMQVWRGHIWLCGVPRVRLPPPAEPLCLPGGCPGGVGLGWSWRMSWKRLQLCWANASLKSAWNGEYYLCFLQLNTSGITWINTPWMTAEQEYQQHLHFSGGWRGKVACERISSVCRAWFLPLSICWHRHRFDWVSSLPRVWLSAGSLPSLFTAASALAPALLGVLLVSVHKWELFAKVDCICILSVKNLMQTLTGVHTAGLCAVVLMVQPLGIAVPSIFNSYALIEYMALIDHCSLPTFFFSPQLYSSSLDGSIKLWDFMDGIPIKVRWVVPTEHVSKLFLSHWW